MPIDTKSRPLGPGDHAVDVMADIARAYRLVVPRTLMHVYHKEAESSLAMARENLDDAFELLKSIPIEHGAASVDAEDLQAWRIHDDS